MKPQLIQELEGILNAQFSPVPQGVYDPLAAVMAGRKGCFYAKDGVLLGLNLNDLLTDTQLSKRVFELLQPSLKDIKALSLADNTLTAWTFPSGLRFLNLNNSSLSNSFALPESMPELELFFLKNCKVETLAFTGDFSNLKTIQAQGASISKLQLTGHFPTLQYADFSNCKLQSVEASAAFPALTNLFFKDNKSLASLETLTDTPVLETLNLANSGIKDLSPFLAVMQRGMEVKLEDKGDGLLVKDCPLEVPTPELVSQGREAVLNFFEKLEKEGEGKIREAKMLIVGQGYSGKTAFLTRLTKGFDVDLPMYSTKGIDIEPFSFKKDDGEDFLMHVWDFGGQSIYHATHQFFLTKRSLYVLLDNTTLENNNFDYWLQIIELMSDKSPVLILQNCKDGRSKDLGIEGLKKNFKSIVAFHSLDLKNDKKLLENLKEDLCNRIENLPHVNTPLPKTWVSVREKLQDFKDSNRPFILDYDYEKLCADSGVTEEYDYNSMSSFFHDVGVCLFFRSDTVLKRFIFLDNEWVTGGVYAILDNEKVKKQKGKFKKAEAKQIWANHQSKLPVAYQKMTDELLHLMTRFELCYQIADVQPAVFIAPQLLPEDAPFIEWDETDNLQIRYNYPFLPKGIISRVIVGLHQYIEEEKNEIWKYGVVFYRQNSKARVVEHSLLRTIAIHAKGAHAKELVTLISEEIERVNRSFHALKVEKQVPCVCSECKDDENPHFFNHKLIMKAKEKGVTVQCQKSLEPVDALKLLENVFPSKGITNENLMEEFKRLHSDNDRTHKMQRLIHQEVLVNQYKIDALPKKLQSISKDIQNEIEKLSEGQLLTSKEQAAFFEKMEALISTLPKQEQQHFEGWQHHPPKHKLKFAIPFIIGKWEMEYDKVEPPKSWAEFKSWFVKED